MKIIRHNNKYRQQMFANNCIFTTNEELIKLILPVQIQFLESQKEVENQAQNHEQWYRRWLHEIKYLISKLFVQSQIKKSELEIAIESSNYKQAKKILDNIKNTKAATENDGNIKEDVYSTIYNTVVNLNDLKQMINDIYLILEKTN